MKAMAIYYEINDIWTKIIKIIDLWFTLQVWI